MHKDKVYIQDVTKGVYFVGAVIKMERLLSVYFGDKLVNLVDS